MVNAPKNGWDNWKLRMSNIIAQVIAILKLNYFSFFPFGNTSIIYIGEKNLLQKIFLREKKRKKRVVMDK